MSEELEKKLDFLDFMFERYRGRLRSLNPKETIWDRTGRESAKNLGIEIRKLMIEIEKGV